eukprot:gene20066-biopygen23532
MWCCSSFGVEWVGVRGPGRGGRAGRVPTTNSPPPRAPPTSHLADLLWVTQRLVYRSHPHDSANRTLRVKERVRRDRRWKARLHPEAIRIICAPGARAGCGPDRGAKAGIPRSLAPTRDKLRKV